MEDKTLHMNQGHTTSAADCTNSEPAGWCWLQPKESIKWIFALLGIFMHTLLSAQINSGKISIHGRASLEMRYYNNPKGLNRRPPFILIFNGQPEVRVGQWVIPTRLQIGTFDKPFRDFNRYGISPRYKWFTLHAGHTTLNWSKFALESRPILGAGIELSPGKLRLGAFTGFANRSFEAATYNGRLFTPQFTRKIAAARIGIVSGDEDAIDLTLLTASDDPGSLDPAKATGLRDAANGVLSLHVGKKLGDKISADINVGASAYTEARKAGPDYSKKFNPGKIPGYLTRTNSSTIFAGAYSLSLKYTMKESKHLKDQLLQLNYERIDPGYQSMGLYYLINDIQRLRAGFQFRTPKNIFLGTNVGIEHNNIVKTQAINNRRIIAGINFNYAPASNWNWNVSIMNYAVRLGIDRIDADDSLVVNQANRSLNLSTQGLLGKGKNTVTAMLGYQSGNNIIGSLRNKLSHAFLSLSYRLKPFNRIHLTPGFSINNYKSTALNSTRYIPSITGETVLKDKFRLRYNMSFMLTYVGGVYGNLGWQNALSGNWNINTKNTFSIYLLHQHNFSKAFPFSELQFSARYGVRL